MLHFKHIHVFGMQMICVVFNVYVSAIAFHIASCFWILWPDAGMEMEIFNWIFVVFSS